MVDKDFLIEFETKIGNLFNEGKIAAPIHLYSGNEDQTIDIFKEIDIENDWVCCTWRNHYQGLLKGIPPELITSKILKGKSMVMNLPKYKFICSSIVGGIPSIAAGIALAIKEQGKKNKVWCWVGDMSAETGHFHEAYKYSLNHKLPITFIVEDNKKSVCTPTNKIWGRESPYYLENNEYKGGILKLPNLYYYQYDNKKYPHAGAGKRVQF
jgi:pyruvate dehydrogenase E1 component alpha subunit|tara:strand:- start:732 stop:1364 length:633 start_codon:yes stop_codon:yes gene_type:complete